MLPDRGVESRVILWYIIKRTAYCEEKNIGNREARIELGTDESVVRPQQTYAGWRSGSD